MYATVAALLILDLNSPRRRCTTSVPAHQETADQRGSRFIRYEATDERNDTR